MEFFEAGEEVVIVVESRQGNRKKTAIHDQPTEV